MTAAAEAENAGPSPTVSVGCEPHGNHYDCDGPRVTDAAGATTPVSEDEHEREEGESEHNPEDSAGAAGPSPTESIGCEPHGDHYHCEAPRPTSAAIAATYAVGEEHEHEEGKSEQEHDHEKGDGAAGPSPTESVGCEVHGDQYHCEGPRTAAAAAAVSGAVTPSSNSSGTITSSAVQPTGPVAFEGAASGLRAQFAGVAVGVASLLAASLIV